MGMNHERSTANLKKLARRGRHSTGYDSHAAAIPDAITTIPAACPATAILWISGLDRVW